MNYSINNRHLIVISGEQSDCQSCATQLTKPLERLVLEDPNKAKQFLGQEFDAVIFSCFEKFDANAFGAISGTIRVGGYLLLLKPKKSINKSLFLQRLERLLGSHDNITSLDPKENHNTLVVPQRKKHTSPFATKDQHDVVEAIIHVVKGHRRRPLVITADRGRGKSASLGLAANQLFKDGYKNIIVCAPSKKMANVVFQYADTGIENEANLTFYSPDELNLKRPNADLVLIDEAAAIPLPFLVNFLKHYSRIVFSSTQHGYEGSGRGFSINFRKVLDSFAPNWKACKLETPIRWNENDSLEAFIFEALLLNAEPIDDALIAEVNLENCQTFTINKQDLLKNDDQLSTLFGLLVSAHYQTKPSDLMQLLDDKSITIHTLQFNQKIIAVVLLIKEGEIDAELAHDIFAGSRRLKGHLIAQSLAANIGIEEAPTLTGARISRIAVHPMLQQRGFGSHLLEQIFSQTEADYLSTSFGATLPVMSFWQKAGFKPVYLGIKRDASSGTHSVMMIRTKTPKGGEVCKIAQQRFAINFPHLLAETFCELEAEIASALLIAPKTQEILSDDDVKELKAFAYQQRGYENSIYPLWTLICNKLPNSNLNTNEKEVLIYKVLQKRSWQRIAHLMKGISGKKEALALLRHAVGKLL